MEHKTTFAVFIDHPDYVRFAPPEKASGDYAPGEYVFFNAARPLYGGVTWTGDFRHGVFYAAVNLAHEGAQREIENNLSLDGHPVVVLTQEVIERRFAEICVEQSRRMERPIDPADWDFEDKVTTVYGRIRPVWYTTPEALRDAVQQVEQTGRWEG